MDWLKSEEGDFEVNASWDWKPVEVHQEGAELDRDLEHILFSKAFVILSGLFILLSKLTPIWKQIPFFNSRFLFLIIIIRIVICPLVYSDRALIQLPLYTDYIP